MKRLGGDGKTTPTIRTDDQSQIALFWLESSLLKWSRIARTVATDKGLDVAERTSVAILDMALTDGYIAMVASKITPAMRPVTAIRSGGDATGPVPNHPKKQDYPSGHSIEGGVGLRCSQLFGTDQVNFATGAQNSLTVPPVTIRPRCFGRSAVSPKRQMRMRIPVSSLGSISATPPQKEMHTVIKLASVPPLSCHQ